MNELIDKRINQLEVNIVKSAQKVIRIKSVKSKPEQGKPFGDGINECLESFLNIAQILGLETKNLDGYAGHVEIGEGDEILGILCHLDVVPEGKNWSYSPYGGEIHDGRLYGRGSIDDKGPAIAALYALKAVKDSGENLNKRIRLIVGTDEESGWEGLKYYLQNEESPDMAFSPDAEFPVIHGEKGILTFKLSKKFKNAFSKNIDELKIIGGNLPNMVPDYSQALLKTRYDEFIKEKMNNYFNNNSIHLEVEKKGDKISINSFGKSAHGSLPEEGINAISQLMVSLNKLDVIDGEIGEFIQFYTEKIGMEYNGQSIGCKLEDEQSGKLTFNVGGINISEKSGEIIVNVRYPVTYSKETILEMMEETLEKYKLIYEELSHKRPLYVEKDNPLVEKLMKVYQDYTGDMSDAITIGGGTYARAIENAVAYGPLFPGEEELAHQKDEYIVIENLILSSKIYGAAILELAGNK